MVFDVSYLENERCDFALFAFLYVCLFLFWYLSAWYKAAVLKKFFLCKGTIGNIIFN